jgi:hypothetical protein
MLASSGHVWSRGPARRALDSACNGRRRFKSRAAAIGGGGSPGELAIAFMKEHKPAARTDSLALFVRGGRAR